MAALTLKVDNAKISDEAVVTQATVGSQNGSMKVVLNSLTVTPIDQPNDPLVPSPNLNDGVPMFQVTNAKSPVGFGKRQQLLSHPTSKRAGIKNYSRVLMIFAVNGGKIDGNGTNMKASTNLILLMNVQLAKVAEWPCDDWVTAVFDYTTTFTAVP